MSQFKVLIWVNLHQFHYYVNTLATKLGKNKSILLRKSEISDSNNPKIDILSRLW
ncbi:MAG: hypothetical protein K0S41_309 [Anaerocolumna sp.]|jgi:hypothetical protein|nr:hypothetical protein [Anaerocolumna sp.]